MDCYYLKRTNYENENLTDDYPTVYCDCVQANYGEVHPDCESCDCKFPSNEDLKSKRVIALWTGSWPCLCNGEWILYVDGKNVTDMIPEEQREEHMRTYGTYRSWRFEDWEEVWGSYTNGLKENEWLAENDYWVSKITTDKSLQSEIFKAIQSEDWRHNSCGGCI